MNLAGEQLAEMELEKLLEDLEEEIAMKAASKTKAIALTKKLARNNDGGSVLSKCKV